MIIYSITCTFFFVDLLLVCNAYVVQNILWKVFFYYRKILQFEMLFKKLDLPFFL